MAYGSNYTFESIIGMNILYSDNNRLADRILRRHEQPDLLSCWCGSQFGHSVHLWTDIPDPRNLLLNWRLTPLHS
jgi:hypothetical protein